MSSPYKYVLQICDPGETSPRWAIAFGRYGEYQIINLEVKPISGKIRKGKAERVILEDNKLVDQTIPIDKRVDYISEAVKRALNGKKPPQ